MIIRNKSLFYFLSFTWGLPLTLIGCIVAVVLKAMGYKPKKWGYCYYFEVGEHWGGVNLGPIFITCKNAPERTRNHEHGHALQNCCFGFLTPFVVHIPSAARYWHRRMLLKQGKIEEYNKLPDYDAAWFEGSATKLGAEFITWFNENTKMI